MKINKKCPLILNNLYEYDFPKASYNILKSIDFNLKNVNSEEKIQRVYQIGLIQKHNKKVNEFINTSMNNLLYYYIQKNNILETEIIVSTKDGFILNRKINNLNDSMEIEYRNFIYKLIITIDRKSYIKFYNNEFYEMKGNIEKTQNNDYLKLFYKINYINKKNTINGLNYIRDFVLYKDNNIKDYIIIKNKTILLIPVKNLGLLEIENDEDLINLIDLNDIDRNYVWENIVWKFIQSIFVDTLYK